MFGLFTIDQFFFITFVRCNENHGHSYITFLNQKKHATGLCLSFERKRANKKHTIVESIRTASACFTFRRSYLFTDKIESPTNSSPHWPARPSFDISDINIGNPCSFPPVIDIPNGSLDCRCNITVRVSPTP